MIRSILAVSLAAAAALSLSACELRRDGAPEPQESAEPVPSAEPSATASGAGAAPAPATSESPVASIIREDAGGQDLAVPVEALNVTVPFGGDGNDFSPASLRALREVLDSDALREGWPVILRGHSDSAGNDSANLRASRARAEAVAAWLVERGVDDDRIEVIAFGEQNPIAPNARPDGTPDETGRARNRRVDVEIAPRTGIRQQTGGGQ